jgi:hypothetical protein
VSRPTKRWVESRLRTWIDRLGLTAWAITLDWDTPADEGAWAQCWRSNDYDKATIYLCEGWADLGKAEVERLVVHELLHLVTRDLSRAHDFVLEAIEDNVPANNIAVAAWKRAEEGVVDRLSFALVAAFGEQL